MSDPVTERLCQCGCGAELRETQPRFLHGHARKVPPLLNYIVDEGGCWVWQGTTSHGYGGFVQGKKYIAHRWFYEHFVGPIPAGLTLDHLCHTRDESCPGGDTCPHRACVNPDHLEPVTMRENLLRGRTLTAAHARKTHCPKGHPYDGENTRIHRGQRHCRACSRARSIERSAASRAVNAAKRLTLLDALRGTK